jgi:hypothetical protein
MTNVGSCKIETALDLQLSLSFDLLGDDFTEDELLGEILRPDDDAILAGRPARGE